MTDSRPIGVAIQAAHAAATVEQIRLAESMGIERAWQTTGGAAPDALTTFAAALVSTERILLGTAIIPTWPRHPIAIAQQVVALESLAPGRLRLGIGPSHEPAMAPAFGVEWRSPLTQLREYLTVLRALLHEGEVDFEGSHVTAHMRLARTVETPIMASALRPRSFETCGELADGAISWVCPAGFLEREALPALQRGAERAGRETPPLIAHIPICVSEDIEEVRAASRQQLGRYAQIPFYNAMFADAGFPDAGDDFSDGLIDALVVHGSEQAVAERLGALLDRGFGEILAMPLVTGEDREASIERSFAAVARAARG